MTRVLLEAGLISVADPCGAHPNKPEWGCPSCIEAAKTRPVESEDAPNCPDGCGPLLTPIYECNHDRVRWEASQGKNTWCPCCGGFFQSSDEDAALARAAFDAYLRAVGLE